MRQVRNEAENSKFRDTRKWVAGFMAIEIATPLNRGHWAGVVAVMGIAAALRFGGITGVGIQFEDEAAYAADARLWHRCACALIDPSAIRSAFAGDKEGLRRRMDELGVHFEDRYLKPSQGYTLLGSLAMFVVGDQPAALVVVNALCGTIAVLALYFLGRALFTPVVGLVAALLLAVSPYHLFYCRGALADASAGCFSLIGVALWAIGRRRHWPAWGIYGISGLAIGYSLICHYRYSYVIPVLLLLDAFLRRWPESTPAIGRPTWKVIAVRWLWFGGGLALPALFLEAAFLSAQFVAFLADAHFPVKSYFQGFWAHYQMPGSHGTVGPDGRILTLHLAAIREYAFYFLHWHGAVASLLAAFGTIIVLRARREAKFPAILVVITLVLLSAQPNVVARAMSTALPYLFLCLSAGCGWLATVASRRLRTSAAGATALLGAAVAVPAVPGAWHVVQWRSQLPDLCAWLAGQGFGTAVVAEETQKYELYLEESPVDLVSGRPWRIQHTPQEALVELKNQGVRWVITDPQRWHFRNPWSKRSEAVFAWWQEFEDLLTKETPPVVCFDHLRAHRWEFLAEGPGLAYLDEMTERNEGELRVFELSPGTVPVRLSSRSGS